MVPPSSILGTPAVSILLPAYNASATLPAALRSIRRQSFPDWECIVVDDGSTDATADCVRDEIARDPRFLLLPQAHAGLVSALQVGLAHCRGHFVARMDADDLMHRRRLELQIATLVAEPDWSAVGSHVRCFPRRDLGAGRRAYESWLNRITTVDDVARERFVECPVAHPTILFRTDFLRGLGYRDRGWPEDYDLLLRALAAGHRFGIVPQRLHSWRDSPQRLSRTSESYSIEAFTRCKAEYLARGFLAEQQRYILWGYGGTGKSLRRALAAHGRHPAYIIELHPRRLGATIRGAPVLPPESLASIERLPLIASVAGHEARSEIRAFLANLGWCESIDFVCAA